MYERCELIVLDLSRVSSCKELHEALACALDFPNFYGRNWDAFWDAITGLIAMPAILRFEDWSSFAARLPNEARSMRGCLEDMAQQFPESAAVVEYT